MSKLVKFRQWNWWLQIARDALSVFPVYIRQEKNYPDDDDAGFLVFAQQKRKEDLGPIRIHKAWKNGENDIVVTVSSDKSRD